MHGAVAVAPDLERLVSPAIGLRLSRPEQRRAVDSSATSVPLGSRRANLLGRLHRLKGARYSRGRNEWNLQSADEGEGFTVHLHTRC